MKISSIEFIKTEPVPHLTDPIGFQGVGIYSNYYFSDPDEGYWIVNADEELTEEQILEVLQNDENLDKYYYEE